MNSKDQMRYLLGLQLHQDEAVQRQNMPTRIDNVKSAYDLMRYSKRMRDVAMLSNKSDDAWVNAYEAAKNTDDYIHQLLTFHLHDKYIGPYSLLFFELIILIIINYYAMKHLKNKDISQKRREDSYGFIFNLSFLLLCLFAVCVSDQLKIARECMSVLFRLGLYLLGPTPQAQKTMEAAFIRGIKTLTAQQTIADHMPKFIALKNHHDTTEDEMCCVITHQIMRDPVYCRQGPHRFDRPAILEWLRNVRKVNPCTELPLSENELITDYRLRTRIADYLEEQVRFAP